MDDPRILDLLVGTSDDSLLATALEKEAVVDPTAFKRVISTSISSDPELLAAASRISRVAGKYREFKFELFELLFTILESYESIGAMYGNVWKPEVASLDFRTVQYPQKLRLTVIRTAKYLGETFFEYPDLTPLYVDLLILLNSIFPIDERSLINMQPAARDIYEQVDRAVALRLFSTEFRKEPTGEDLWAAWRFLWNGIKTGKADRNVVLLVENFLTFLERSEGPIQIDLETIDIPLKSTMTLNGNGIVLLLSSMLYYIQELGISRRDLETRIKGILDESLGHDFSRLLEVNFKSQRSFEVWKKETNCRLRKVEKENWTDVPDKDGVPGVVFKAKGTDFSFLDSTSEDEEYLDDEIDVGGSLERDLRYLEEEKDPILLMKCLRVCMGDMEEVDGKRISVMSLVTKYT